MKDYNPYLQRALKSIVREVLTDVAQNGLTDESYYVLSFQTPKSKIPDFVRAKYPEQMTIILQNQFQDLQVNESDFTVVLGFGGVPCEIRVPFDALLDFADPSQKFGLTFTPTPISAPKAEEPQKSAEVIDLASLRKK